MAKRRRVLVSEKANRVTLRGGSGGRCIRRRGGIGRKDAADATKRAAADAIQRWWRSRKRVLPSNAHDPITLEPLARLPVVYRVVEACGSVTGYDPRSLRRYMLETGDDRFPTTRRPISLSEALRLDKCCCAHRPATEKAEQQEQEEALLPLMKSGQLRFRHLKEHHEAQFLAGFQLCLDGVASTLYGVDSPWDVKGCLDVAETFTARLHDAVYQWVGVSGVGPSAPPRVRSIAEALRMYRERLLSGLERVDGDSDCDESQEGRLESECEKWSVDTAKQSLPPPKLCRMAGQTLDNVIELVQSLATALEGHGTSIDTGAGTDSPIACAGYYEAADEGDAAFLEF